MKKKFILIFLLFIIISNCGYIEIRNKNLIRPKFDNQKTLVLKQGVASFYLNFYVYNREQLALDIPETQKETLMFKIKKNISINENTFEIKDIKNERSIINILKENNKFYIKEKEITLFEIEQIYKGDFLNFKISYKNQIYLLIGEKKEINNNIIHSIVYTIIKNKQNIGYIYKELYYMKNMYEIIINKEKKELSDFEFVTLNVFIDLILKENGIYYRE